MKCSRLYVRDYMFAMPKPSVKFVKISCLENFRLYGTKISTTVAIVFISKTGEAVKFAF